MKLNKIINSYAIVPMEGRRPGIDYEYDFTNYSPRERIEFARKYLFDFEYQLFNFYSDEMPDEDFKKYFETLFLMRFYYCDISGETLEHFKMKLQSAIWTHAPEFNREFEIIYYRHWYNQKSENWGWNVGTHKENTVAIGTTTGNIKSEAGTVTEAEGKNQTISDSTDNSNSYQKATSTSENDTTGNVKGTAKSSSEDRTTASKDGFSEVVSDGTTETDATSKVNIDGVVTTSGNTKTDGTSKTDGTINTKSDETTNTKTDGTNTEDSTSKSKTTGSANDDNIRFEPAQGLTSAWVTDDYNHANAINRARNKTESTTDNTSKVNGKSTSNVDGTSHNEVENKSLQDVTSHTNTDSFSESRNTSETNSENNSKTTNKSDVTSTSHEDSIGSTINVSHENTTSDTTAKAKGATVTETNGETNATSHNKTNGKSNDTSTSVNIQNTDSKNADERKQNSDGTNDGSHHEWNQSYTFDPNFFRLFNNPLERFLKKIYRECFITVR